MFYLICFGILCVLAVLNVQMHDKLSTQILNGLAAIMLICIAGLRYETGGDWDSYTTLFADFPSFSRLIGRPAEFADISVEEGFVLLCALVKSLGGTVQHLLYFNLEMIYIRQATAVALCFFALQYIPSKRIVPYMIFILLACTFHRVAALMIPLYFLLNIKLPSWAYLAVVGIGAAVMLAGIPWIQTIFLTVAGWLGENYAEKAELYTEDAMFAVNRGLSLGFILNLAIFAVIIFFKEKIDALPYGTIMLNMFFGSLILYYYCFELVEVSNRVRLFFLIGIIALLPMVLEVLPLFLERLAGLVVVALYCFSFSRGIFLESPQSAAYNPYQNYIEYKINPRPSTGKQRLEQSKKAFQNERKH